MINFPPRLDLARLPTPLTFLQRFSEQNGSANIWLKRDELTGTEVSGNKVRKLEFSLAQALAEDCDTMISCGGVQSNHCRATAVLGARLGLKVHLILRGERPAIPDGNLLMDYLAGATIDFVPERDYHRHPAIAEQLQQRYALENKRAYFIPIGASDEVGLWGYVAACAELKQDFTHYGFTPDFIVTASGSGGTQSGLIIGNELYGLDSQIIAFAVCDDEEYFYNKVKQDSDKFQRRYKELLPKNFSAATLTVTTLDGYVGPGYGKAGPEVFETISMLARTEGIFLDPVYTGKAFHGMLQEMRTGRLQGAKNIVFIHTGGLYGLFPQKENFKFA